VKCMVTFRLADGVTPDAYEAWFRTVNVPAVRQMRSVSEYRVWRLADVVEGEPPFRYVEEMEVTDREAFGRELEELPAAKSMLDQWAERVSDQSVVFVEEVAQA
jgi:hypothetical protein